MKRVSSVTLTIKVSSPPSIVCYAEFKMELRMGNLTAPWTPTINNCNEYLANRTGDYEKRAVRYRATCSWLREMGLDDTDTVYDIGAGRTEFDYCLRVEFGFRGRYVPIDGGIDGTDLNSWSPKTETEFFVALEILEHLYQWRTLVTKMQQYCTKGIAVSTPNPRTTDVLGMDPTHVTAIEAADLDALNFSVREATFYGGVFSQGSPDSLFGTWVA